MKVLAIGNVPLQPHLGAGKTRIRWSEGLRSLGHEVQVLQPQDYELGYGRINKGKKFRQAFGGWKKIVSEKLLEGVDVLALYGDDFWPLAIHVTSMSKRPLVVASSDGVELQMMDRLWAAEGNPENFSEKMRRIFDRQIHYRLSKFSFSQPDTLVCGAKFDIDYCIKKGWYTREETAVIPPGLDSEYLDRPFVAEREERIAFTGSWIPRKGISTLAKVLSRLMEKRPTLEVDLFGTGRPEEEVKSAFSNKHRARLTVHPKVPVAVIPTVLERSKVFFFPTEYEGFGMAISEAMASGCAVVTTPTGFGLDLEDGKEGILCNFQDVDAMEAAIERLLDEDSMRIPMAHAGWKKVQSLRWEKSIRDLEESYLRWLSMPRRK